MADDDKLIEIAVGPSLLRLPTPWFWQKRGGWCAINEHINVTVHADLQGDEGPQVGIQAEVPTYVPMVVLALVVLANNVGDLASAFVTIARFVTRNPETLPPDDDGSSAMLA